MLRAALAVALAAVAGSVALDSAKPAMRDAVNYDAHLNTMYKRTIDKYEADYELIKDKDSLPARKAQMIIKELELSRAEACKKVLHMHKVNMTFAVDPYVDETIGNMEKGYDAPIVPLRKLLATPKSVKHQPTPAPHEPTTANSESPAVLHPTIFNEKTEEEHVVDLGDADGDETLTAEQAGLRAAEGVIAQIKARAAVAIGNSTGNVTEVTYSMVDAKVQSCGKALIKALADHKEACPYRVGPTGEALYGKPTCDALTSEVAKLKTECKSGKHQLKKLSKVKEECSTFVADIKGRRAAKSRRRAWGVGVNESVVAAPPLSSLEPELQRWFPKGNKTSNSTNETAADGGVDVELDLELDE